MGKIDDLYRKYAVKVNNGSGCLFQPDISKQPKGKKFTYVLTAKHNIQNEEKTEVFPKKNIKVYSGNEQNTENKLNVLEVFHHKDDSKDAAILKVDYVDDNINLYHTSLELDNQDDQDIFLRFFGYPDRKKNEDIKTAGVKCRVESEYQNKMIEIVPINPQFGHGRNVHQNIKGFSGCGVFKKEGNNILLVGILSRLAGRAGAGGNILILPIDYFNEIISPKNKLLPLIPNHLASFEGYKNEIWQEYKGWIDSTKKILENEATKVISKKISPKLILDNYEDELCIPYNKNWVYDCDLWSGWLEFLTYNKLINEESESNELEFVKKPIGNKKFFYNNKVNNWLEVIKEIKNLGISQSMEVDCIVINTKCKSPQVRTKISNELLNPKIEWVITPCPSERKGSQKRIDDGNTPIKKYPIIHLQEFKKRINENKNLENLEENGDDAIIKELQTSIKQAFRNE